MQLLAINDQNTLLLQYYIDKEMERSREGRTYRVRQLSAHMNRLQTVTLLCQLAQTLGSFENVQIFSLASSLSPWNRSQTKTATLMFK